MIFPLLVIGAGLYLFTKKESKTNGLAGVGKVHKLSFPKGTSKAAKDLIKSWANGNDAQLRGAFYKRNNSYSRSYNASQAEREGRFPLTRAAEYLGVSVAAMKKGMEHADYTTSEWHHVGKYANKVDYYDAAELQDDYKFWFGAMTKSNKKLCMDNLVRIAKKRLAERLKPKSKQSTHKQYSISKQGDFRYQLLVKDLSAKNKIFADVKKEFKHRYGYDTIEISPSGNGHYFWISVPVLGRMWQECQKSIKAGRGSDKWNEECARLMSNTLNISNNQFKLFIDWGTKNPNEVDNASSIENLYEVYKKTSKA